MKHSLKAICTKGNENGNNDPTRQGKPSKNTFTKNNFNMKKVIISIFLLCFYLHNLFAQTAIPIPSGYFGINYWLPPSYINCSSIPGCIQPNGDVDKINLQALVSDMGGSWFRIGGDGYDNYGTANGTGVSNNDYIAAINAVLTVNPYAKFLVQIPWKRWGTGNAANAGTLVLNIENFFNNPNYTVTIYYSIGNEWDIYSPVPPCSTIAAEIKAYAIQMKKQKSYNIKIVAPSVTNFWAQDGSTPTKLNILQNLINGGGANDYSEPQN